MPSTHLGWVPDMAAPQRSVTQRSIPEQTGRRAIVTGASAGLGLVTAVTLARAGARVTLAVRDLAKTEVALKPYEHELNGWDISIEHLDLADLASVKTFALSQREPIDLLINNAGVMLVPERRLTDDGFELQMGVNHLGHFALTGRLLTQLARADAARVVSLSSTAHRMAGPLDLRLGEGPYQPMRAYAQSKLACALFGFELDRRLKASGSPIRSLVAHPGYSATTLFSRNPSPSLSDRLTGMITPYVGSSPEEGAQPILWAATALHLGGGEFIGPRFMIRGRPVSERPAKAARDLCAAQLLWEASERETGVSYP